MKALTSRSTEEAGEILFDGFNFKQISRRGNLFADLSRVVIERSRGLGRRVERQDGGSRTDLKKNLRENCSRRSARLGIAAQYNA